MDSETFPDVFALSKKLILIITFFAITPLTLLISSFSLLAINQHKTTEGVKISDKELPQKGVQIYASLPSNIPGVSGKVIAGDARPQILAEYLKNRGSPLLGYEEFIVSTADKYKLDYRLLVAIAQKESGLCRVIPENSYNCWGWGIHSKGTLRFESYQQGIETVSQGLKEKYIDLGYTTVEEIMTKYAHPSSTTWADGVID